MNADSCKLFPGAAFDVVVVATSKGGLNALNQLFIHLPASFPIALVVVQHLAPNAMPAILPYLLRRQTVLNVKPAIAGDRLQAGTIYVPPPDWHIQINAVGAIELSQTDRVNFTRPAADVLFASVAENFRDRAIAIVLTGTGQDGAAGLLQIKQMGGTTIVQDRASSEYFAMPNAAIQTQAVDQVLPLPQIAATLIKLVCGPEGELLRSASPGGI
ncbi:chemotaxis protein CheB [Phormidesmis sp. 146-35]